MTKQPDWLEKGYNAHQEYQDQLQLLLIYNLSGHVPVFLKLLPGSIRDVSSLQNAVQETGFEDVTIVVDKGFWSSENFAALEQSELGYLAAVRRNATMLEYVPQDDYETYFGWRDRYVLARSYPTDGDRTVHHFLDMTARAEEETTALGLVEAGKRKESTIENQRERFGTLALLTNREISSELAYELYKQRIEIESTFDVLVNTFESDKTYMQDREAIEGYLFVLFLALYAHSALLERLREAELLDQFSVADVLTQLSKAYRVVVDGEVIESEVPNQTQDLAKALDTPITQNV